VRRLPTLKRILAVSDSVTLMTSIVMSHRRLAEGRRITYSQHANRFDWQTRSDICGGDRWV
jgi:hypothetical protein